MQQLNTAAHLATFTNDMLAWRAAVEKVEEPGEERWVHCRYRNELIARIGAPAAHERICANIYDLVTN